MNEEIGRNVIKRDNYTFIVDTHFSKKDDVYETVIILKDYAMVAEIYGTERTAANLHKDWYNFVRKEPLHVIINIICNRGVIV